MWKAAFSGRSETGSSAVGRSNSTKKKSVTSGSSRRSDDEKRKTEQSSRSNTHDGERNGDPRALTESAVRLLDDDDEAWEDEDKDARSERRSVRSGKSRRSRSEKEKERERDGKRKSSSRKSQVADGGDERAIPDMGSFEQFPGQYAGGAMGPGGRQEEHTMSGALPNVPDNQFGLTRSDTYGAASDYYLDEGQSVGHQPGVRAKSPNMLVNPDLDHLQAASVQANPAQDTGQGSAADFYGRKGSPVLTEEPQSMSYSSKTGKAGKNGSRPSTGSAVAAGAAALGATGAASAYYNSQNQSSSSYNQKTTTSSQQQQSVTSSSGRPSYKPSRETTDPPQGPGGGVYYAPPQQQGQGTYGSNPGTPGKQPPNSHSNSHAGLYAAGAATAVGAAGLAAYEMNQRHNQAHRPSMQSSISPGNVGVPSPYAQPTYRPGGPQTPQQQMNGSMAHQHYHEHKGPLTRLKDGLFNIISSEEDTIKMEMYTEYIGVCKYCFDPRSSPYDAPRRHHHHTSSRRDSFEDLRKRRSIDKMRRRSREGLSTAGSRVDKDSRYYADKRKSSSKADLVGAGLAAAGVAAGANALFNSDGKNFDDTYSVKSGHRESSAVRRRSRSSSREKRRRSSHGVVGREGWDSKNDYVVVRTSDGRTERQRVRRSSRSSSREKKGSMLGTAAGLGAGAALGAAAVSTAGRSRRSREHSPNGAFVRKSSRRSSSSSSSRSGGGMFGFFSPSSSNRKRRGSKSKRKQERRQGGGGFFNFGGDASASGSDSDLAFGASRTDLSLRRKNSGRNIRKKKSDEHLAATVAGIGATAAAIAAAQKGHRVTKRPSGVHLGAKRDVKYATPSGRPGEPMPVDDEWEDELPSDVDDASSVGSDMAFHDDAARLKKRQSRESIGSQSSGAGGLGAWGWRWGGKDKEKSKSRPRPRPENPPRPSHSGVVPAVAGAAAAGAVAGAAMDAYGRHQRTESFASISGPQEPMQYVDPRPMSEASSMNPSRHASIPGAFDSSSPPLIRPGPGPIQQPKPVAPIQPAFTKHDSEFDGTSDRPKPRRTQSSPVQSNFATDAALIGAAAVGTAALIGSQRRKSKDVRFGFTEEQERKHDAERRKEQERIEEEQRRRQDRERDLKREAERHTREQDVLRAREQENRRQAEAELQKQRDEQKKAEEQAEHYRQLEREKEDREQASKRDREKREQRDRELTEQIERHKRELEEQKRRSERNRKREDDTKSSTSSSMPWGAVAAGAAAAGVGAIALSEHEKNKDKEDERESRREARREDRDRYSAREVTPSYADTSRPESEDIYNPAYFSSASRSRSPDHARHVEELARRAADKVVSARAVLAEDDERWSDHRTQAEIFAPEEIRHSATWPAVSREAKATDSGRAYSAADIKAREEFDETYAGLQSGKTKFAPYGVPKLGLVSPTPPPSATKRSQTPPANRSSRSETVETEGAVERKRSRSISWGVDQTHVYDVPTPESHHESRDYISSRDEISPDSVAGASTGAAAAAVGVGAAVAAGVALNEAVKNDKSRDREGDRQYETREYAPYRPTDSYDAESSSWQPSKQDDTREYAPYRPKQSSDYDTGSRSASQQIPPVYQQPFYESVSDIGIGVSPFKVDSPGTDGAPPVQGFVEGEIEATPAEEKAPRIPGGFDDDVYDEPAKSETRRDVPTSQTTTETVAPPAEEPAWEPPLSKKEKKKREKAAKRGESVDDATFSSVVDAATKARDAKATEEPQSFASVVDAAAKSRDAPSQPQESAWEPPLSKKEQKKREKALKRSMSEDKATSVPVEEASTTSTRDAEPEATWEPPLNKKEKKKREKEAKKQGFVDVAGAMMTAGGIAAVASTMTDTSTATSKGTDRRSSRELERDIRDIEPATVPYTRTPPKESSAMPGGWDSDTKEKEDESSAVDPFQYQVHDESWSAPSQTPERPTESATSKTSKRESVRFNEPATSSPLKSEVPFDDKSADKSVWFAEPDAITNGHDSEADKYQPSTTAYGSTKSETAREYDERQTRSDYTTYDRETTESPRRISPDDLRSVTSDPTGDRASKGRSRELKSSQYYEEPDEYDDVRSVAASEPADSGSSRKSKRRSRQEDDDTASVTSSRSRREKEDSSSAKKAGFFGGLFGKKAVETMKSDGAVLSRTSTKDSKDGDGEDGERRRRRKHRSSEYGDDDDTRSVTSESRRKHRSSEHGDDDEDTRSAKSESRRKHRSSEYADDDDTRSVASESRPRRRRTRDDLDDYERTSSRPDDDRDGEDHHKHHHRRQTDDGDYSSGHRQYHRRKTDEDGDEQDQSFLGMRVEGMPPLPGDKGASAGSAQDETEQGDGNFASAERNVDAPLVSRDHADAFDRIDQEARHRHVREGEEGQVLDRRHADAFNLINQDGRHWRAREEEENKMVDRRHADALGIMAHERGQTAGTVEEDHREQGSWDDDVEYLPSLPDSRPESPTGVRELDVPQRHASMQQSPSQSRVPIRFPFGKPPPTPGHRTERSISFGGSLPSSPMTPTSTQKKARPTSSEIRPLYLVEHNRKTSEVEDVLPSLPSSKPSSRASSMVGSDEYESAAEDITSSSLQRRPLSLDISHPTVPDQEEDYLGSEQTTPRATEFPRDVFDKAADKSARPEPQFYTWDDLMKDERNRQASVTDQANNKDLPELPPSRPESSIDSDEESTYGAAGLAAAAAVGGAAVLGYHALSRSKSREKEGEPMRRANRDADVAQYSPPRRDTFEHDRDPEPMEVERYISREPTQDVERFVQDERTMEEGNEPGQIERYPVASHATNELDNFFDVEEQMEDGEATTETVIGDEMDVDRTAPMPVAVAAALEHVEPTGTYGPPTTHRELERPSASENPLNQEHVSSRESIVDGPVTATTKTFRSSEMDTLVAGENDVSMEEATNYFMAADDKFGAGETEAGIPTTSLEQTSRNIPPTPPKLTRKQSKKSKKKAKSTSQTEEWDTEPADPQDEPIPEEATSNEFPDPSDEFVVDKTADSEQAVVEDEDAEPRSKPRSKSRTLSTNSGSRVAALMSDIIRRGSGNSDTGLKAEAVAETSQNDAVVHTSLDNNDYSAARQLEVSLGSIDNVQSDTASQKRRSIRDSFGAESRSLPEAPDTPVLQPEPEEPWETSPTVSRKQSKKDKKRKKKQQLQWEPESEPHTEIENDIPQTTGPAQSRDTEDHPATDLDIAESTRETPNGDAEQREQNPLNDTSHAAEVPLPTSTDDELELAKPEYSRQGLEDSPTSARADLKTSDLSFKDDNVQHERDISDAQSRAVDPGQMEVDTVPTSDAGDVYDQAVPTIWHEPVPMDIDDEQLAPPGDIFAGSTQAQSTPEEHEQHSAEIAGHDDTEIADPTTSTFDMPIVRDVVAETDTPAEASNEQDMQMPQEPEEEFSWTSSKKKGKKGKKGKKSAMATPPIVELEVSTPRPDEDMFDTQPEAEPESASLAPETSREIEDLDLSWEAPSTSKKKKGKKGERTSITPAFETAAADLEPSVDAEPVGSRRMVDEPVEIADAIEPTVASNDDRSNFEREVETESAVTAPEAPREDEDPETFWEAPSKKRKAKKGKRASISPTFDTGATYSEPFADPKANIDAPVAAVDNDEKAAIFDDDKLDAEPQADTAPVLPEPDVPSQAEDPEVFWEPTSSKKKNGKKGKRVSIAPIFDTAPGDSVSPADLEGSESQNLAEKSVPITGIEQASIAPEGDKADTQLEAETAPAIPPTDLSRDVEDVETFWQSPESKKKKPKKGKRASINPSPALVSTDHEPIEETAQQKHVAESPLPVQEPVTGPDNRQDVRMAESSQLVDITGPDSRVAEQVDEQLSGTPATTTHEVSQEGTPQPRPDEFEDYAWSEFKPQQPEPPATDGNIPTLDEAFNVNQPIPDDIMEVDAALDEVERERSGFAASDEHMAEAKSTFEQNPDAELAETTLYTKRFHAAADSALATSRDAQDGQEQYRSPQAPQEVVTLETTNGKMEIDETHMPATAEPAEMSTDRLEDEAAANAGNAEDADSFWTPFPSKKKGKKGTKNKASALATEPEGPVEDDAFAAQTPLEDNIGRSIADTQAPQEESIDRSIAEVSADGQDTTEIAQEDSTEFWTPMPKGKKGKKSKKSALSSSRNIEEASVSQSAMLEDEPSTVPPEDTLDQSEIPTAPVDEGPDNFWAAPAKGTKGKKGKKNKRAQTLDFLEAEPGISDQARSQGMAPFEENIESTPAEAGMDPVVGDKVFDRQMDDARVHTTLNEADPVDLPPLPGSPSSPPQDDFEMATLDTAAFSRDAVPEQVSEPMEVDTGSNPEMQLDGTTRSTEDVEYDELHQQTNPIVDVDQESRPKTSIDQEAAFPEESQRSFAPTMAGVDYSPSTKIDRDAIKANNAVSVQPPEKRLTGEFEEPATDSQQDIPNTLLGESKSLSTPAAAADDYDFAAHLARGLEDSGFNPDLVAKDPVFQRRASPPGAVAEADPEEAFTSIRRKKKGKKAKKATATPSEEETLTSTPAEPSDGFNDMLEKTLAGAGFGAAGAVLLQQAASSSNDVSANEIGGGEFSFTTSKKKKGKKSKQAQREYETWSDDPPKSEATDRTVDDTIDVSQSIGDQYIQQLPDNEASSSRRAMDEMSEQIAGEGPIETALEQLQQESIPPGSQAKRSSGVTVRETGTAEEALSQHEQLQEPSEHVAMGGGGEMDVDEQDRIYQAFRKKNKRDKKKKKLTASQPDTPAETPMEEYSDPTERMAPLPTSRGLFDAQDVADEGVMRTIDTAPLPDLEESREQHSTGFVADQPSNPINEFVESRAPEDEEEMWRTRERSSRVFGEQLTSLSRGFGRSESEVGYGGFSDVVDDATETAKTRNTPQDEHSAEFGSLSNVVSAATAAAGMGAIERHVNTEHEERYGRSHSGDTREIMTESDDHPTASGRAPSWSFANLDNEGQPLPESPLLGNKAHEIARDSGYQTLGSPSTHRESTASTTRGLPDIHTSDSRESLRSRRSAEPLQISTDSGMDWDLQVPKSRDLKSPEHARTPSSDSKGTDLESSTKNRASYLFQSTPETLKEGSVPSATPISGKKSPTPGDSQDRVRSMAERFEERPSYEMDRDTFSPPPAGTMSPRAPLDPIPEEHHAQKRTVSDTDARDHDHSKASRRSQTPQSAQSAHARHLGMLPSGLPPTTIPGGSERSVSNPMSASGSTPMMDEGRGLRDMHSRQVSADHRSPSVMSNRSNKSNGQYRSPDELRSYSRTSNRSSTPTLRRTSLSGDLRAASRRGDAGAAVRSRASLVNIRNEAPPTPPSGDEIMDAGASRSVDMSDVYVSSLSNYGNSVANSSLQQGYGGSQASQVSPTRPPSMRKRQSMHIMDLESKLDQLTAENQALHDARGSRSLSGDRGGMREATSSRDLQLRAKDNEINQMRTMLQPMQEEIARLTEINNGLTEANRGMVDEGNSRYGKLQQQHAEANRELENVREEHGRLTSGVRAAVEAQLATALADKNAEIHHLREELDVASEKIRSLQVQIQSTKSRDFLTVRDEDYFDGACQKLCQHVQQWVLRFSKVSDDRVCRLSADIKDDKVEGRLDNAILDGSDVDKLLGDRIKRRDVFMSVLMTMVWEFIFTRYLFGMDREQRQKLKALEKILAEVGPPRAVAQWRATTLTLLARRPQFAEQKDTDTEAVAGEIFALLCMLLPPPSNAHSQLLSSLQKVVGVAVDLSLEMRTQRAEYIMLPPLQPEYDTNGDLMRKVHFNASLMNERSGMFSSNGELEDSRAVVKIVLFPLVVKKGDEVGEGEEEIVVCPAQVLVHNDNAKGKKIVRVQSGAMEIDDPRRSRQSLLSAQGSTMF